MSNNEPFNLAETLGIEETPGLWRARFRVQQRARLRAEQERDQLQEKVDWLVRELAKYAGVDEDTARIRWIGTEEGKR